MRSIRFRFSVSLLFVCFLPGADAQCAEYANSKIERCVLPVVEYAKVLNQQDNSTGVQSAHSKSQFGQALQFPKLGGQVFRELCRLIRAFDLCVQPYKQVCPRHITINLIQSSYGFLCNEGYETFMNSADCLMNLDQKPAVKHCHDQTLTDIENANSESTLRMDSKLTRMCSALNYFAACVQQHIWNGCGVEAWHVIFHVLNDTTRTLMPSCVFSGESAKLDVERRQQQAEESSQEFESSYSNQLVNHATRGRSTLGVHQLAGRPEYPSDSRNEDVVMSRSLEAQSEEGLLEKPYVSKLDDGHSISFEIHEESEDNRLSTDLPMSARFGTWTNSVSQRSPFSSLFAFMCISFVFYRLF